MSYPKGRPKSEESKRRASESLRARFQTPEWRDCGWCGAPMLLKTRWDREHKEACSTTHRGLLRHKRSVDKQLEKGSPNGNTIIPNDGTEISRDCVICGRNFPITTYYERNYKRTCDSVCKGALRHQNAIGNRVIASEGYVRVMVPDGTPGADKSGRMLEHRYVMQQAIGRPLEDDESVHHRDGNKRNNILENLQLTRRYHGKGIVLRCKRCGSDEIESVKLLDSNG